MCMMSFLLDIILCSYKSNLQHSFTLLSKQKCKVLPQPNNNPKQLKPTSVEVVLWAVRKPPHHHIAIMIRAVLDNLGNWFSVCKWKMTWIFLKMENKMNLVENGRRTQFCLNWKTTSIYFENGRRPHFFDLIFLSKRRPQKEYKENNATWST